MDWSPNDDVLERIDEDTQLFKGIANLFIHANETARRVHAAYRVRNQEAEQNYNDALEESNTSTKPARILSVYHGTSDENIVPICRDGFRIGGVNIAVAHGKSYGIGVYTTKQPDTAFRFANIQGEKIIVCQLAVTPNTFENDYCFVQPNSHLVLPLFVVSFRPEFNSI